MRAVFIAHVKNTLECFAKNTSGWNFCFFVLCLFSLLFWGEGLSDSASGAFHHAKSTLCKKHSTSLIPLLYGPLLFFCLVLLLYHRHGGLVVKASAS